MSSSPYEIGRHGDRCHATDVPLSPGDRCVAVLVESTGEDGEGAVPGTQGNAKGEAVPGTQGNAKGEAVSGTQGNAKGEAVSGAQGNAGGGVGGLVRFDFSEAAWDETAGGGDGGGGGSYPNRPSHIFAHWRHVMPEPTAKVNPFIDNSSLSEIFDQLEGAQDTRRLSFRFVLALVLIRKRMLVHMGAREADDAEDDRPVMLVRRRGGGGGGGSVADAPLIEVIDPGLDGRTIADATEQLSSVLRIEP